MKTLTAHRLSIQFDFHPKEKGRHRAKKFLAAKLDQFTVTLQREFPDACPQITTDSEDFTPEDITID